MEAKSRTDLMNFLAAHARPLGTDADGNARFEVPSKSRFGATYRVRISATQWSCSCPAHGCCIHINAAFFAWAHQSEAKRLLETEAELLALHQHAQQEAQSEEDELLADDLFHQAHATHIAWEEQTRRQVQIWLPCAGRAWVWFQGEAAPVLCDYRGPQVTGGTSHHQEAVAIGLLKLAGAVSTFRSPFVDEWERRQNAEVCACDACPFPIVPKEVHALAIARKNEDAARFEAIGLAPMASVCRDEVLALEVARGEAMADGLRRNLSCATQTGGRA